ncbi:MAG: class I SAM-dependent methyltransferase [Chloroflexia bacterium]|nr:class I SAM-dependent methyltransferase [Bacteroidales bacterium]NJO92097.1 class I SAM-dependent methyltransferase [Chloroflexia bacterium]
MIQSSKITSKNFLKETVGNDKRKYLSAINYSQYVVTLPLILKYADGNMIDVGCGDLHYRKYIEKKVKKYDSIDFSRKDKDITYIGDVQNMEMISDQFYDSAICLEVLEHLRNPFKAVSEIYRILKKDGILVLSVPHMSRLHEEPYDFFRFTKYGLKSTLEDAGFKIIEIQTRGGLFSFIGHQVSSVLISSFYHIPVMKNIIYYINKFFIIYPCVILDRISDGKKRLAAGYTCVVKK